MNDQTSQTAVSVAEPRGRVFRALRGFLTGILGLGYAFVVWTAVLYAVELSDGGMTGYGWFVLLLPAIVSAVIFAVAVIATRRKSMLSFVLVLLAGLGLSAVFLLDTFSYAIRNLAALTGI